MKNKGIEVSGLDASCSLAEKIRGCVGRPGAGLLVHRGQSVWRTGKQVKVVTAVYWTRDMKQEWFRVADR